MNKMINFILWPAVGGLVFSLVLLQMPRLAEVVPALNAFQPPQPVVEETRPSYTFSDAFSKAAPAVVSINSTSDVKRSVGTSGGFISPFSRPIYLDGESTSLGSGVILSPDGYIITSYHIFEVHDSDVLEVSLPEITITLYNGETMEARIVSVDPQNDLALLKVDGTDMAYLTPAEQSTLDAGDIVLAIGNPRNIGQSVTLGIISALLRSRDSYVIQTDAAINPGSSGGALIDVDGRLVGINSTIVTESGGSEGISFAIPAHKAHNLMLAYIEQGPGGFMGIDGRFLSRIAGRMLLDMDVRGLWVEQVSENGPADKGGLRVNDVIIDLAGIEIVSNETAIQAIQTTSRLGPGETVLATVYRDGEIVTIPIVLGVGEAVMYWSSENEPLFDPNPFSDGLL